MDPLATFTPYYPRQAILMVGCLVLAAPALVGVLRTLSLRVWVLAAIPSFILGFWLPLGDFFPTGHALLIVDLMGGGALLPAGEWLSVRPGAQTLAYLLPRLSPPGQPPLFGLDELLLLNRWALMPMLLGVAAASVTGDARRNSGGAAMVLAVVSPALLAWATTLHFLTPSLALGTLGLALGLRGKPGAALALAVVAYSLRAEGMVLALVGVAAGLSRAKTEPRVVLALAVLALIPAWEWSRPWGGTLAHQVFQRSSLSEAVQDGSGASHLWANLHAFFLGGPWSQPLVILTTLGLATWIALRVRPSERPELRPVLLGGAFVLLLLVPLLLIDFGDRSRLPASLIAPILVAQCAGVLKGRARPAVLLVAGLLLALPCVAGFRELDARWMQQVAGPLGSRALADAGEFRTLDELRESGCVVVWGGVEPPPGVRSADERPDLDHSLLRGLYDGGCVFWLPVSEGFFADARQERLDRARVVLGLDAAGWLSDPPHPDAILWKSRPR